MKSLFLLGLVLSSALALPGRAELQEAPTEAPPSVSQLAAFG